MQQVMLVGHRETGPLLLEAPDPHGEQLDAIAVEVVQLFAKHIELSSELQAWTTGQAATASAFANIVALAKLL